MKRFREKVLARRKGLSRGR